jgi:hypothetical protein
VIQMTPNIDGMFHRAQIGMAWAEKSIASG